jgi:deoxyribodipyrimidine photo-lyase
MSRDQRVEDNWALQYAQERALTHGVPFAVVFNLSPSFLGATKRQYGFMIKGLMEVEQRLSSLGIPFFLLSGDIQDTLPQFLSEHDVGALVTDFSPLRIGRMWREAVSRLVQVPFFEVDAHNIIPAWVVSPKQEYGAYTIRPKIRRLITDYLDEYSKIIVHPIAWSGAVPATDWGAVMLSLSFTHHVDEVHWLQPGESAGLEAWKEFMRERINSYDLERNSPGMRGQSDLSPYLHYGHLSAGRIVMDLNEYSFSHSGKPITDSMHKETNGSVGADSIAAFLEELVVRRELSDNFCLYNLSYDSFAGFPDWAKKSLDVHRADLREYLYTREELEEGKTHDELWNASQMEMVRHGKMHGYMRMYWAKKILEWTVSPEQALEYAIYLNDTYELDGRDPNGYTGIAWSVGGVHDRAWFDRPVFGKVRYMSLGGMQKKFNVPAYISYVQSLV